MSRPKAGPCKQPECARPIAAWGWCELHYRRWKRTGDPEGNLKAPRPIADRFWPKVRKGRGCWTWMAAHNRRGYGVVGRGGKNGGMVSAHRVAWEITYGPIPDGLWVLHKCDNRSCVRPKHLYLGTAYDNTHDMLRRGRHGNTGLPGERNHKAKLTVAQVRAIRREAGTVPQYVLAERYGVTGATISAIVQGKTWTHA